MDSFIPWIGGKKLLRKEIVNRFPDDYTKYKYVEVFGGAAWILFYKQASVLEIYNDINGELVNLFKCVKYHAEAIEKELECMLNSREIFEGFKNQNIKYMTDIQRAARYLYLIKASYGAKVTTFGVKCRDISNMDAVYKVKDRLSKVVIENKNFSDIIKQYNKEDVLLYLDPPYHNTEKLYDTGNFIFNEDTHTQLRDMLKEFKGKFLLSYNDDTYIRELYKDFNIEEISRSNNLSITNGRKNLFRELIIKNY